MSETNADRLAASIVQLDSLTKMADTALGSAPTELGNRADAVAWAVRFRYPILAKVSESNPLLFMPFGMSGVLAWWISKKIINQVTRSIARNELLSYYQELAVKQNLIIRERDQLIGTMQNAVDQELAQSDALRQRLNALEQAIANISKYKEALDGRS